MKTEKIMILFIIIGVIFICGCMGRGPSEAETTTTIPSTTYITTTTVAPSEGPLEVSDLGKPSGYTVAYDITVSTEGDASRMTQTHYISGKKFRLDMTDVEGETEMRFYNIPGGTYICVKIQGAWNCIGGKTQGDIDFGFDIENMTSGIEEDLAKSIYDGTQVIAGVTAQCFRITVSEGTMRYCVHSSYNIPLLMESTGTAMGREKYIKIIATSFTPGVPSDSVFELPAEPIDLSGITDLLPK